LRVVQDLHDGMDCTRLRVVSAVDQTLYTRMHQRSGTHRARLNCSKQLAVPEAMVTNDGTGFAERDDLGMGGGVVARQIAVPAMRENYTVADHNGSHRHFSYFQSALRVAKGFLHKEFVGGQKNVDRRWSVGFAQGRVRAVVGYSKSVVSRLPAVVVKPVLRSSCLMLGQMPSAHG